MKRIILSLLLVTGFIPTVFSQVAINTDGTDPDNTAVLHLKSTNKGFLPPRLTTAQRDAIEDPADGLMIYNYDNHRIEYFDGQDWRQLFQQTSGNVICGNDFYDSRDNKIYGTVLIGSQCWMKENLNYGSRIDASTTMTQNGSVEKYCYDNSSTNCDQYGALYQWDEMMEYNTNGDQGICPEGWHVPSDDEWKTLEGNVDGTYGVGNAEWDLTGYRGDDAGYHLKSITGWGSGNNGDNSSGFTCLPGGYAYSGSFNNGGATAYLWSRSTYSGNAWMRISNQGEDQISRNSMGKTHAYSLRCIKD